MLSLSSSLLPNRNFGLAANSFFHTLNTTSPANTQSIESYPAAMDEDNPPSHGSRSLLNLPGEIRNKIYKLALTSDKTLLHVVDVYGNTWFLDPDDSNIAYNQLAFVSRQVRFETRGLELGLNNITFRSQSYLSASNMFIHFLRKAPPRILDKVQTVYIGSGIKPSFSSRIPYWTIEKPGIVKEILNFCRSYPLSTVHLRLNEFNMAGGALKLLYLGLTLGVAFREYFRGVESIYYQLFDYVAHWRGDLGPGDVNLDNFRIFPTYDDFEQGTFCSKLEEVRLHHQSLGTILPYLGGVAGAAEWVEVWYKKGV